MFAPRSTRTALLALALLVGAGVAEARDGLSGLISPGPLSRAHAQLDRLDECTACHALGGGIPEARCLACHEVIGQRARAGLGLHARADGRCIDCHTEHRGSAFDIVALDRAGFDHERRTGHALGAAHLDLVCGRCHDSSVARELGLRRTYLGLETACVSCHADAHQRQFLDARGHVQACDDCHAPTRWEEVEVDHDATRFPLEGEHRDVACADCHGDGRFRDLPARCADCHADPHDAQFRDPGGALQACTDCHDTGGWTDARVDHDRTRFPLTGRHQRVGCADCHEGGVFRALATDCASCHADPHEGQFREADGSATGCASCHDTLDWNKARIDHDTTRFPLTGAHRRVECESCHAGGRFQGAPLDCAGCHDDVHDGQFRDARSGPADCASCHDTLDFEKARVDHEATRFPLTGAHRSVECASCHVDGRYRPLAQDCASCHTDPHDGQFRDASGAVADCASCHEPSGWEAVEVDHDATRFPLEGAHVDVACASCHVDGRFRLDLSCKSCHEDPHAGGQGEECSFCHSVTSWEGLDASAHEERFPLLGMHAMASCDACHLKGGAFVGRDPAWGDPLECISCHVDPHQGQFAATCGECHGPVAWRPTRFRHEQTAFPLRGAHRMVECGSCHAGRLYRDTPSACFSCHVQDFEQASGVDHRASALIDCERCHGDVSWTPARFEHAFFPLSGGHRGLACESCHSGGAFAAVPDDCVACHSSDFQSAPRHVALGLPAGDCEDCHTTGTFGRHEPVLPVDCFACHRAEYVSPATRPNHLAEGFGTSCEECHSTRAWEPADEPGRRGRR